MNDKPDELNEPQHPSENNGGDSLDATGEGGGGVRGTYQHKQLSARVPEHVSVGVFSTGAILLTTNTEFVLDFLIRMGRPHQVAARVILPPMVIPQIISALKQAIERWQSHFGTMPSIKSNTPAHNPSLDDVYGELKMADTIMSGVYANGVMISFSPAEFSFDFITNFFPKSAVSQRVYLSVPQVPRFKDALEQTFTDYQQRMRQLQQNQQNQQHLTDTTDPSGTLPPREHDDSDPTQNPSTDDRPTP